MTAWLRVALTALVAVIATGCLIPVPAPGRWDDDRHDHYRDYRDRDGDRHRHGDHRRWDRERRWDHDRGHRDRDDDRDWRR